MAKIFISYRREDSAGVSGRIYDRLVAKFGATNIFKDVDNIPPGVNFGAYIRQSLSQCQIALIIIGRQWESVTDETGARRLDDPEDWVRTEIEAAFALGMSIIPVLVDGAHMPKAADLPDAIRELAAINGLQVRNDPDFATDIARAISAFDRILSGRDEHARHAAPPGTASGASRWWARGASAGRTNSRDPIPQPVVLVDSANLEPQEASRSAPTGGRAPTTLVAKKSSNRRRWLIGGGVTVMLVGAILLTLLVTLRPRQPETIHLESVAMVSASEGWAVGIGGILHYHGGQWTQESSPTNDVINSVAMVSASDGWAVGGLDGSRVMLHYSGGQWTSVDSPATYTLNGVAMASASEGWAVGDDGNILHYSDGQWTPLDYHIQASFESVTMVSASEGWAVGGSIWHYSGGQWTSVGNPGGHGLNSVTMVSASEGWAVGYDGIILHYSSGQWTQVSSPTNGYLGSVAMVSASEGWAVGYDINGDQSGIMLHYSGGQWTKVNVPTTSELDSVAMVSASEGWAVGENSTILHYSGGRWTKVNI